MHRHQLANREVNPQSLPRRARWLLTPDGTGSISLGRDGLVKHGSSGLYRRRITSQPLPGIVCIQLPRFTPSGWVGPKDIVIEPSALGLSQCF
jgi:hypothetical protein